MFTVKHLCEPVEATDGVRLWIEPIGLTRDLRRWCRINHLMSYLGPPRPLWEWFEEHPECYGEFRARYHEHLAGGKYRAALQQLACAGQRENVTLVHSGDDAQHNTATALYEFISELQAYCEPDAGA